VALQETENAMVAYAQEQNRHRALLDSIAQNRQSLELADSLYKYGRVSFLDVLDVRRSLSLIGTLTMMGTMMLTALSVAPEREQEIFDQLLVTPFRPSEIMAGKAIPNMIIGLSQSTTILLVAQLGFHIPFVGSFVVLYAGLALFLMAAVGLGLFVSSISKTMQQAMLYAFVLVMPFALLSGFTTPFSSMPDLLQSVMVINPLRYALDITKRVYLEGAGFVTLVPDFLPLIVIGLVTLSGAAWLFRRRLT
jgi:ABC-2 type transport system permease protein